MQVYLPIAEMSANVLLLLGLGGGVGFVSGMFGVGGGFLATPLLIFAGIPPVVAVATEANHVVGSSVSGALAHWRRGNIDFKMGGVLLVGGFVGSSVGTWGFTILRGLGQIDFVISLCYVLFLGTVGLLMFQESLRAWLRRRNPSAPARRLHTHTWMHGLPFKVRFRRSRLYISALLPLTIGFLVGLLSALMGVGGGFVMVPAMIYILGMPTSVVVGTSLFQIIFVTANVTFLQALHNQTVDIVLAVILLIGGVIGAQLGSIAGARLRGEQVRTLLALIVLLVCARVGFDLFATPSDLYSLGFSVGGYQ